MGGYFDHSNIQQVQDLNDFIIVSSIDHADIILRHVHPANIASIAIE